MKKLLALLVALMLLVPAAMAEDDSTLYWLSLYDPQVTVDGETVADLTGVNLDLNAAVTDTGVNSLILELYAGEEYDYVTGLFAQLDANGLGVYLAGMNDMYLVDLARLAGFDLSSLLSLLPVRTMLEQLDLSEVEVDSLTITAEDRIDMLESLLGDFVYESVEEDGAIVHRFSIAKEEGEEMFATVVEALRSTQLGAEIPEDAALSVELSGEIIAQGDPDSGDALWTVQAEGNLFVSGDGDETVLPMTAFYTDDMQNVELSVKLTNDSGEEFTLALTSSDYALEDGREEVDVTVTLSVDGEDVVLSYYVMPDENSPRMDYRLEASVPSEDSGFAVDVIADFDSDSAYSFYIAFTMTEDGEESAVDLYYVGDPADDPESDMLNYGWAEVTLSDSESTFGVSADVYAFRQDMSAEDWVLDSSDAVSILDMTDEDMSDAMTEATSVLQEMLQVLMEKVPALADFID